MVSVCLPSDALLQHLPSYLCFSYFGRGVSPQGYSSKAQPLLLTLNEGYLLTAALPDLQRGIAPLGPPAPVQPRLRAQHSENEDHGIRSHHFMGNRWGNSGNVRDFIFLGSKIMADGNCSHEIKRRLLLGRKVMTNLDSIFKSRDITLPKKVRLVKAIVFPVVMYACESWTVKKAEC